MSMMKRKTLTVIIESMAVLLLATSPVYANVVMIYGMYTFTAPGTMTAATWGLAGILIVVIEAWFFKRFWDYSWGRAIWFSFLLNLLSTVIGGFISCGMFTMSCSLLPALVIVPLLFWLLINRHHPPQWLYAITIPLFVAGSIAGAYVSILGNPVPRHILFLIVETPLIGGFALSLMIESWIASNMTDETNFWTTIAKANLASYLLLIFLFPFFAPNPYSFKQESVKTQLFFLLPQGKESLESPKRMVELLHLHRSNLQYLLGLRRSNPVPSNYDYEGEITFCEEKTNQRDLFQCPNTLKAVVDDILTLENLTSHQKDKLEWMSKYLECFIQGKEMIDKNNQDGLTEICQEWTKWSSSGEYPFGKRDEFNLFSKFDEYIATEKKDLKMPFSNENSKN